MGDTHEIDKTDILYLFDRLGEPVYFPKGEIESTCFFDVSPDYLPSKFHDKASKLLNRFNTDECRKIDISSLLSNALIRIPLDQVLTVKRRDNFSLFLPLHRKAAGRLIGILMGLQSINELVAYAAYIRDRVNSQLFAYALSIAIVHRDDTKLLKLPPYSEIFPKKFIGSEAISNAKEIANIFNSPGDRVPIEIPRDYTGNDGDIEHRLAYFREDIGINLHHWHWHLVYPFEGPDVVVKKDRRGELFYYLHRQILARYNVERFCNNLNLVNRLLDWDQPIEEAYYPMINTDLAGKAWPARSPNMRLSNINRPDVQLNIDIENLKRWKERIYEAIHKKKVIDTKGKEIDIDNESGIDVLGNIIEASVLTPNADYYGDLHNNGHNCLAYIHDPEYKYMQTSGVMSETTTTMRDPVFYRWHAFIDDLFIEHKNLLPAYDKQTLSFPGIQITNLELCSYDINGVCNQKNSLNTFFMKSDINLSRGLDFTPRGAILARITHLNHNRFLYTINVTNTSSTQQMGTVRIFMAPAVGFGNFDINLTQQKNLMIEMDRFVAILERGPSTIQRESDASSITIPFQQTFRNLDENRPQDTQYNQVDTFNYCGCGWPQHMLVPKGTAGGYRMILFAMISDYKLDKIEDGQTAPSCRTGVTFCGLRDRKYPDKKSMGFPFDRPIRNGIGTLQQFLTPNMATAEITIIHSDIEREKNLVSATAIPVRDINVPSSSTRRISNVNEIGQS